MLPNVVSVGANTLTKTKRGWKVEPRKIGSSKRYIFPSLVQAYASTCAGWCTIGDLLDFFSKKKILLLDCANENDDALLAVLRQSWMNSYFHIRQQREMRESPFSPDKKRIEDLQTIRRHIRELLELKKLVEFKMHPVVHFCLDEAAQHFGLLAEYLKQRRR